MIAAPSSIVTRYFLEHIMSLLNYYVDVVHDLACFRICLLVTVEENIISIFQITKFIGWSLPY